MSKGSSCFLQIYLFFDYFLQSLRMPAPLSLFRRITYLKVILNVCSCRLYAGTSERLRPNAPCTLHCKLAKSRNRRPCIARSLAAHQTANPVSSLRTGLEPNSRLTLFMGWGGGCFPLPAKKGQNNIEQQQQQETVGGKQENERRGKRVTLSWPGWGGGLLCTHASVSQCGPPHPG